MTYKKHLLAYIDSLSEIEDKSCLVEGKGLFIDRDELKKAQEGWEKYKIANVVKK